MKNEKLENKIANIIEKAISQANVTYLRKKVKVTDTEYDEDVRKPVREVVEEREILEKAKSEYDFKKIKELTELWIKLKASDEDAAEKSEQALGGVVILPDVNIEEGKIFLNE